MKKIVITLRIFFSLLLLQRRHKLILPFPGSTLRQLLVYLSETTIVEKGNHIFLRRLDTKYFVKVTNDDCFQIDGPVGYKRTRLLTEGRIINNANINNEVIVELKFKIANKLRLYFMIVILTLLLVIAVLSILFSFYRLEIVGFLILIAWIPSVCCIVSIADFIYESTQTIKLLRRKFNNLS
jgi:hypothetical protein